MNIWVAVWSGDPDIRRRAERSLRSVAPGFPGVDPCTWTESAGGGPAWAAALTTEPRPGRFGAEVAGGDGGLVIVDGIAVHDGGTVARADEILAKGAIDVERLEGQFAL